jgi:uncharacterized membrane protein YgaE (UPF0421/DUF939 family)
MLGAMAAVQPTFKDSLESCITQILGVVLGALAGLLLMALKMPPLVAIGIGIVCIITLYNALRLRYSPVLACIILVTLCINPDMHPVIYAGGRIWDTAIGLSVGMAINTLVFPYDNSRQIRQAIETLDKEVIEFLENMFDGDDQIPDAGEMTATINEMGRQLATFSNQRLILRLRRQKAQLESFRKCEGKSRELLARMEVLSRMERPGRLNEENRRQLAACGADIRDTRPLDSVLERDVVTNYHVRQILRLRRELLDTLKHT